MIERLLIRFTALTFAMAIHPSAMGESVVGSRHDLSKANTAHVCEFCHTPHQASLVTLPVPLWSRMESTQNFPVYGNANHDGGPVLPGVVTRLCLSCHDGVNAKSVAYGRMAVSAADLAHASGGGNLDAALPPPCENCTPGHQVQERRRPFESDLRGAHPVAVMNPTFAQSPEFRTPPDPMNGWAGSVEDDVKLFRGAVECGSCHNAHNPRVTPFLRTAASSEGLCLRCHRR